MTKRPPKPEGQAAKPRFKVASAEQSFNKAVEASRRLTSEVNFQYEPKQLVEMDDRAIAILKAAHVENMLRLAIRFYVRVREEEERDMFRSEGPLGTFSRAISMGYALEIFGPETKRSLDITRLVRNVFAHSTRVVTFETEEVKTLCSFYRFGLLGDAERKAREESAIRKSPKREFIAATIALETSFNKLIRIRANQRLRDNEERFGAITHDVFDLALL